MDYAYGAILSAHRPVHDGEVVSRRHPKMAQLNRAKLFAPFAALSGFDDAVRSKEVPYVPRHILDADETYELNAVLNALYLATRTGELARRNRVSVCVEYFAVCTDINHEAYGRLGLYHTITGIVQKVDSARQLLLVGDMAIPFADIDNITDAEGHPLMFQRY